MLTFLMARVFVNKTFVDSLLSMYGVGEVTVPFHLVLAVVPRASFEYSVVESALELEAC